LSADEAAEDGYRCDTCGESVAEDGPGWCVDCLHIPERRKVWKFLGHEHGERTGCCWGWTFTHRNLTWVPFGDGSGEGEIIKKP
jgi:hypothetical protein